MKNKVSGGVYIHVPFCLSKCYYCDFYSINYSEELMKEYFNSLLKEIKEASNKYELVADTLYFGGGTPSLLGAKQLSKIIKLIKHSFSLIDDAEITLEVNPDTVSFHKATQWREAGINRISMGIQATNNRLLQLIGRRHTIEQVYKAIQCIREAGFKNISIDLMYGLPEQSLHDWEQTLKYCIGLKVNHISAYPLQLEDNTKLADLVDNNKLSPKDDEETVKMMFMAKKALESEGFIHYEIANYAKAGYQSKHNKIYWHAKPYLGFGPAAASYFNNTRWSNSANINEWKINIAREQTNIDNDSHKQSVQIAEFCFLSLRLLGEGLSKIKFKNKFGIDIYDIYGEKIKKLIDKNLLVEKNDIIYLTSHAIPLANQVFVEFLPDHE